MSVDVWVDATVFVSKVVTDVLSVEVNVLAWLKDPVVVPVVVCVVAVPEAVVVAEALTLLLTVDVSEEVLVTVGVVV